MSASRRRAGMVGGGIAGITSALVASVALIGSSAGSAVAQTAPYGTPPPSPSPSAPSSASPAPESSPSASPSPAPEAERKRDEIVAELPDSVSAEKKAIIATALENAAAAFAGLTPQQQVAALESLSVVVQSVAVNAELTQAQVVAAINTARGVMPTLIGLPEELQQRVLTGLTGGIGAATKSLASAGAQQAVIETVTQAIQVLTASGDTSVLTVEVVEQLVAVTAAAVSDKVPAGATQGVTATTRTLDNGGVEFTFAGLKPGTTGIVVLNVTDRTVAAALRAALGDKVIAYTVDANGRATLVLTGTVNDLGRLVVSAPGSALGATSAAEAQAAIDRALLGVVGTTPAGTTAVFAGPAGRPATPSITAKRTPVVPFRGAAVLTGSAQPGTTVQLLGRAAGGQFRVLRTIVVGESGAYSFTVYPDQSMRFLVRSTRNGQSVDSASTVVSVRSAVSQSVARTATRTYRFTGRVAPAAPGTLVNLYRSSPTGGSVLVAQARTAADGTWRITRTFSGTGTFTFFTRSGSTVRAIGGTSAVQRVTIR